MEAGRCNVHDRGMCEHSLTLDVPEHGTWHLQDLIGAWRGHAFPQGLTSAPQWLAIRLNRFKFESGRMQKLRSEMMWSDHVNMPLFIGDNLDTHDVPYEFTAFAIHLGEHVQSGHYRALLYDQDSWSMHYCDDDKRSKTIRTFQCVSRDVYIVFLSKRDI